MWEYSLWGVYDILIRENVFSENMERIHIMDNKKESKKETGRILNKSVLKIAEILMFVVLILICICSDISDKVLVNYIVIVGIVVMFEYVIIYTLQKEIDSYQEKREYHRKQHSYENRIKKWRVERSSIYYILKMIGIVIGIVFILFLMIYRIQLWQKIESLDLSIPTELEGNQVSIGIAVYGVILTMLTVVGSYLKQKSFLFEIDQNQMIKRSIFFMLISVLSFLVSGGLKLFGLNEIGNIVRIIWIVSVVASIYLLLYTLIAIYRETYEKKIIKDMYKLYWREKITITPNKVWCKSNMFEGLGILFSGFMKKSKKFAKKRMRCIAFGNVYEKNEENKEIAKRKIIDVISILGVIIFETFTTMVMGVSPYKYSNIFIISYWIQILIPIGILFRYMFNNKEDIRFMNFFQNNQWGYYVGEEKVIYIPEFDSSSKICGKYLMEIKSIIAFFNLARNMKYEDLESRKVESYYVDCMIEHIRNNLQDVLDDKKKNDMVYAVIPIVICGCLVENGIKKVRDEIQCLLQDMQLDKDDQEFIEKTSLCILRDFVGNDKEYLKREQKYKEMLLSLMKQKKRKKTKKTSN